MKNIGIMTFHDGINFGAFMQVYSLQKALEGIGYSVEIVNYKSKYHWAREYVHAIKKNYTFFENIKKIYKFKLVHKELNIGKFMFEIDCRNIDYDMVFFGSDEIWNVRNGFFGYNSVYFGKGFPETVKRVAYAPSCGAATIEANEFIDAKKELLKFTSISARDVNTFNIIKGLTGIHADIVPDPTFLINHTQNIIKPKSEGYILVYSEKLDNEITDAIKSFAKNRGKKIISIGFRHLWCDENYISIDPFEWLGYIYNADFIFTTMFHGTIFSIIFNKQFWVFTDEYRVNKFDYILDFLDINANDTNFENMIDYSRLNPKIEELRSRGMAYIKNSIRLCDGIN